MSKMHRTTGSNRRGRRRDWLARTIACAIAAVLFAFGQQPAMADARAQAKRMYDRLTGTPPSPETLDALENYLLAKGAEASGHYIINDETDPRTSNFHSLTLKNCATRRRNRDHDELAPQHE